MKFEKLINGGGGQNKLQWVCKNYEKINAPPVRKVYLNVKLCCVH